MFEERCFAGEGIWNPLFQNGGSGRGLRTGLVRKKVADVGKVEVRIDVGFCEAER